MHCTLLIPDLLLPRELGAEPYAGLRPAALAAVLARGTLASRAAVPYAEWVCSAFGVAKQQDIPIAPVMLSADGGAPGHHYWLCADPVHLRADRSRLVIAGRVADIDAAEANALIAALNLHFAADGIEFCAPSPLHWYVRASRPPRLTTTPVTLAVNRDVERNLPHGDDALAWHRVMNETQMILHAHPVNAAREERGAPVVNSVWLWGGGTLPAPSRAPYTTVWSHDRLPRALAAAAGVAHHDLPADGVAMIAAGTDDHHLLVLNGAADALCAGDVPAWRNEVAAFDAQWIEPLLAALRANKIAALTLVACNNDALLEATLTRASMRRWWRRAQPLQNYAGVA